ncbi:ATP-NAD kinase-like domain-containing protein [Mucor lusitanicus]
MRVFQLNRRLVFNVKPLQPLCVYRRLYNTGLLRKTSTLPDKVGLCLSKEQVSTEKDSDLIESRRPGDIIQVPGSTYGGQYALKWTQRPNNVLIVKKPNDIKTEKAFVEVANWLHQSQPDMNIIVEPEVAEQFQKELPFVHVIEKSHKEDYTRTVDFAVTLGGDGTMLHLSSLFPKAAPPVVSFSLGTLCFLMSYKFEKFRHVLDDMIAGKVGLMMRMRLFCSLHQPSGKRIEVDGVEVDDRQVMNEVTLHRGRFPHLTTIDCFVDEQYLTECVADGLIVSTPTGSTAYSLSAGGPISLVLTPICPRSLSFRTVLLPPSSNIELKIGEKSRSQTEVSIDGQEIFMLHKGEYVKVRMSKYPIPCVTHISDGAGWEKDINELLKWNQTFGSNIQ